jgi:5,10-methylenetetrahydrofolate reductase
MLTNTDSARWLSTASAPGYLAGVSTSLLDRIERREAGVVLYGLSPPKRETAPHELQAIAARQVARLAALPVDGIIVYDLQDESERTGEARPFPFLPTVDPSAWARDHLAAATLPKVVYHCTQGDTAAGFVSWLQALRAQPAPLAVLVGAPSARARGGLPLGQAYALAREHAPDVRLGGIAIAERHARRHDEHERILAKAAAGCRFFVTQAVYDVTATKSLLSDYAVATHDRGESPAPIILTFAPCGSAKTLAFMKWLGIAFPRWLENDLSRAADPLATSIEICAQIFTELWSYARARGIPLGLNIESVSIRKAEIDAAAELLESMRRITLDR